MLLLVILGYIIIGYLWLLLVTLQSPAMGTQYPPIPMGKWVGSGYGLGRMGG